MFALISRAESNTVVTVAQLEPTCDPGPGALVDGKGAGPVVGVPGDDIGRSQGKILPLLLQLRQLPQALIFPQERICHTRIVFYLCDAGL